MPKLNSEETIYCVYCKGKGFVEEMVLLVESRSGASYGLKKKPCPVCKGAGKFIDHCDWTYCNYCKGKGSTREQEGPCPVCGGVGKIKPPTF